MQYTLNRQCARIKIQYKNEGRGLPRRSTSRGLGPTKDAVYSVGQFDVALLIFGRKSVLEQYAIRIPTMDAPWTKDELMAALQTLKDSGEFEYVFDVNPGYTGEWWPYAYSPMLQSFGGDLIDRDTFLEAEGVLNGDAAMAWGAFATLRPADILRLKAWTIGSI